jgi:ribonuclease HII
MKKDFEYLIGIDEVGRGPLAGPVAVGAFLIPVSNLMKARRIFRGVKESKQLSVEKREGWFKVIRNVRKEGLIDFKVAVRSEKVIDGRGLSFAIKAALKSALDSLRVVGSRGKISSCKISPADSRVLLDGGLKAPIEYANQKTIIKGDEKEMVIALASICAKVLRDRKLVKFAKQYPLYGFEIHKGYGTRAHYAAIKRLGMCPLHRRSFLKRLTEVERFFIIPQ